MTTKNFHINRMEPLIKQNNNKNNIIFDCTTYKTTATLLNVNQQTIHQHSVSYLSSKWSQKGEVKQQSLTKLTNAVHQQQTRNQLLIL